MSYAKITLVGPVTVRMNQNLHSGQSFYTVSNVREMLSALGTRHTEAPRQSDHGAEASFSYYAPRFLPFEGEIRADTVAERVEMEQNLRKCLSLPRAQTLDDDGHILVQIEDEDGVEKQIYAKVVDLPEFRYPYPRRTNISAYRFAMIAVDPFLYGQALTEETGPEAVYTTGFTLQDGALLALQDDDLPSLQEEVVSGITVENIGTVGTPPLITVHGPTADPVVTNETTGRMMSLDGLTLLTGERVEIDVESYTITKIDGSAVETDASGYLTAASEWIFIEPGYNYLSLLDSTPSVLAGQIDCEFRSAWA